MQSTIDLEFADGEYTFALPLPQINELQTKCGIGIGGLYARVIKGHVLIQGELYQDPAHAEFFVQDIVETLRQGLIGGGKGMVDGAEVQVSAAVANRLIQNYVAGHPLKPFWAIAASVLTACVMGYDPPKKAGPAGKPAKPTATAG